MNVFSRWLHNTGKTIPAAGRFIVAVLPLLVCLPHPAKTQTVTYDFDLQGHRGARGLLPENSIPAFRKALELGVRTLELDVVISGDGHVVVSHDPVMSQLICSGPDGKPVSGEVRLFDLTYEEIAAYDCGSRGNPRFPEQEKLSVSKPLLTEVIAMEAEVSDSLGRPRAFWNIETKSTPEGDGIMHPGPEEFARVLHTVVAENGIRERATIQSFDPRTLQVIRAHDPELSVALLLERNKVVEVDRNLEDLGFVPDIYSPNHVPLTAELVEEIQAHGMLVIPWTVNDVPRMEALLRMGVDGIITDYPDRALPLLAR